MTRQGMTRAHDTAKLHRRLAHLHRILATLLTLLGYLEIGNLLLTGNLLSVPCALAAFGGARLLEGGEGETV